MQDDSGRLDRRKIRIAARGAQERRRHARVPLELHGRFLSDATGEQACKVLDISPGGARIMARHLPAVGSRVIVMITGLGRVEAEVVRHLQGEFCVRISAPSRKRDKLADAITWRFNMERLGLNEDRVAPRNPGRGRARIRLRDGVVIAADVVDVSISGAAFSCLERPRLGEPVEVGQMKGKVARILDNGFAVVFDPPQAQSGEAA